MRYFSFPSLNFFLESLVWVNTQLAWCLYHRVYYFSFPSLNFFLESLVWVNMQLAWCLYHRVYLTSTSSKEVLRTRKFWQNHCWSQVEKRGVKRAVDPFKWIQTSNSGPNGLMYQVNKITTSRVCSWQSLNGLTKIYTPKFYVIGWATAANFPS